MKFYKRQTKEEDTLINKNVHPGLCSTTRLKLKHVLGLLNISQKIKLQVCNMNVEFIKNFPLPLLHSTGKNKPFKQLTYYNTVEITTELTVASKLANKYSNVKWLV